LFKEGIKTKIIIRTKAITIVAITPYKIKGENLGIFFEGTLIVGVAVGGALFWEVGTVSSATETRRGGNGDLKSFDSTYYYNWQRRKK
jgi:hypothetical protein